MPPLRPVMGPSQDRNRLLANYLGAPTDTGGNTAARLGAVLKGDVDARYNGAMLNRGLPVSMKEVRLSEDARQFDASLADAAASREAEAALRLRLAELQAQMERERMEEERRQFDESRRFAAEQSLQDQLRARQATSGNTARQLGMAALSQGLAMNQQAAQSLMSRGLDPMDLVDEYAKETEAANIALANVHRGTGLTDSGYNARAARARALSAMLGVQGPKSGGLGHVAASQEDARGDARGGFAEDDFLKYNANAVAAAYGAQLAKMRERQQ